MGWIGDSMGWKSKSMGWIGRRIAWTHENNAKRRTKVGVRINALPYSAHAAGWGDGEAGCPPRKDAIHRVSPRPDGLGGAAFLPPTARGAAPPRHSFPSQWPIRLCARHESRPSSPLRGVSVAFGRGAGRAIFANPACQIENTALINCKIRGGNFKTSFFQRNALLLL